MTIARPSAYFGSGNSKQGFKRHRRQVVLDYRRAEAVLRYPFMMCRHGKRFRWHRCLAIIPARGGSKALPGKNILNLNGKPLIAYSIAAALEARQVDACYVTTDDAEIADTARQWRGAAWCRPYNLALDHALTADAVTHLIKTLRGKDTAFEYTHLVLLQPTSPLRNATHVDEAISHVSSRARCLMSMVEAERHPSSFQGGGLRTLGPVVRRRLPLAATSETP